MFGWFKTEEQRTFEVVSKTFREDCAEYWPLWLGKIEDYRAREAEDLEELKEFGLTKELTALEDIEARLLQNSVQDLAHLEKERDSVSQRMNIVVAALAIAYAAFSFWPTAPASVWSYVAMGFLVGALLLAGGAFWKTVGSVSPQIRRAFGKPYDNRFHRNVQAVSDFEKWVLNSWQGERLAPVVTTLKQKLVIAALLLKAAGIFTVVGVALSLLSR